MGNLVLSLFPGIDLLGRAFEEEGFCVVRGPDPVWGGDIHAFHPPAGRFDGIIGGPPCQLFSRLGQRYKNRRKTPRQNLIPEFVRAIEEARPAWFLMENVPAAPEPAPYGYEIRGIIFNNRQLGEVQNRKRKFVFGRFSPSPTAVPNPDLLPHIEFRPENSEWSAAVLACGARRPGTESQRGNMPFNNHGWVCEKTLKHSIRLQGLPEDFLKNTPFTVKGKFALVGNGVPLPMGRAVARAVKAVLGIPEKDDDDDRPTAMAGGCVART